MVEFLNPNLMTWNPFAPSDRGSKMKVNKILIKGDSMSVRRILAKTIDTDLEYEAIGIDLAKNCVSAALLTTDGEVV